jgi:hypothetical protein
MPMVADIGLALSVAAAGLWSGLLLTITTILHPMFAAGDGRAFSLDMRRFLPIARSAPVNYVLVVLLVLAPVVALIGLRDDVRSAPFVLTAAGLVSTVTGPLLMSRLLAEPNYAVILGWDPDAVPGDWQRTRTRYFALNWLRGALTWLAFVLFAVAMYLHLS